MENYKVAQCFILPKGLGEKARPLALFFAVCGLFGFLGVFTANQFTETFMSVVEPSNTLFEMSDMNWKWTVGVVLAIITSFVIFGGLTKIAKVASAIVPFMVAVYLMAVILVMADEL